MSALKIFHRYQLGTPIEVEKLLHELNTTKSCGPGDIHPRILKCCSNSLASPQSTILNISFKCGEIPDDWKIAQLILLYKKGANDKVENYRLLSPTSITSKIWEKIVRTLIVNYWTDHQVFIGKQFGSLKSILAYSTAIINQYFSFMGQSKKWIPSGCNLIGLYKSIQLCSSSASTGEVDGIWNWWKSS